MFPHNPSVWMHNEYGRDRDVLSFHRDAIPKRDLEIWITQKRVAHLQFFRQLGRRVLWIDADRSKPNALGDKPVMQLCQLTQLALAKGSPKTAIKNDDGGTALEQRGQRDLFVSMIE